jgi:hypothetical protein
MGRTARAALIGFFAFAFAFACGKPGAAQLQGKWKGTKVDGVGGDTQGAANSFAGQMELDVKGDVITVTYPKDQKQTGHYTVKRADKNTVVIAPDADGPTAEETFTLVDDNTMRWSVDPGRTITFVRE